jgi:hypothetical protein
MNEQVANTLIQIELRRLRARSYKELASAVGNVETKEVVGEDGISYQLEMQVFWDGKRGADIRVMVACDDGRGWRAFVPLSDDFIVRPDGSFAGE